ncbi:MAG: hypothetical protein AB1458_16210 [Bacteroidota bacterium]
MNRTFTDFKRDFYSRFNDAAIFDSGDINLLKVILDGLKVDYASRGGFRCFVFYPLWTYQFVLFLKRILARLKGKSSEGLLSALKKHAEREFLVIDSSARVVRDENGKAYSVYFQRIIGALGREKTTYFVESPAIPGLDHDFARQDFEAYFTTRALDKQDKRLREDLLGAFTRLKSLGIFTVNELVNIRMAIELFFNNYRTWKGILSCIRPRKVYFDNHYHREGCLLAMRKARVETIELQHGLIAPEDIFYLFPETVRPVKGRALFADRILVYGEYWKNRLLAGVEYSEEQISIIGYYHFSMPDKRAEAQLAELKNGKKVILVTTQTFMHGYYTQFVAWLAEDNAQKGYDYWIWVKIHPNEKPEHYSTLAALPNVKLVDFQLESLFRFTDIHISVYSTTLYDALRFNMLNFALYVEQYGDYVNSVVGSGIAALLNWKQNPIESAPHSKTIHGSIQEMYYADFDARVLFKN